MNLLGLKRMSGASYPVNPMKFMSRGIIVTGGFPPIFEYIAKIPDSCVIVEVGSGSGALLKILEMNFPDKKFIGIDPIKYEYIKNTPEELKRNPDFDTTENLIKAMPELIGKCAILVNWPEPQTFPLHEYKKTYTGSKYDFMAINILKPKYILACFDVSGSAGSNLFVDFILPKIRSYLPEVVKIFGRTQKEPEKVGKKYRAISCISVEGVDNTPFRCPVYDTLVLLTSVNKKKRVKK